MKPTSIKITSAIAAASLLLSGCENLTPGENAALAGTVTGLAVGLPLALSGVDPRVTIPVTAGAVALAAGGTYLVARHQATERQTKIAEQRARIYLARQAQRDAELRRYQSERLSSNSRRQPSRFIAVRAPREDFNTGQESVMIYDRQTGRLIGNRVYDLRESPRVGSIHSFDGYDAEYIGG